MEPQYESEPIGSEWEQSIGTGRRLDRREPYHWFCCHDVHWDEVLEKMGRPFADPSPYLSQETSYYQMACTEWRSASKIPFLEMLREMDVFGRLVIPPPIQQIIQEYRRLASRRRTSHVRLILAVSY